MLSRTKAAGVGVVSELLQLGPREPMKDVFPTRVLPWTVKLVADDMAIAKPKAPVNLLLRTVPEVDTLEP